MDLYDLTVWGFIVAVACVFLEGSHVRQSLAGLATGIDHRLNDLESQIKELGKGIDRIDRKVPKPYDPWSESN
jgi:hypothetical protein